MPHLNTEETEVLAFKTTQRQVNVMTTELQIPSGTT